MIIGVPKEIKDKEYRVSLTPGGAESLIHAGHQVAVQRGAGVGSGFSDGQYEQGGARIAETAQEVYATAEMILKVKEPLPGEYPFLRPGLLLFTYLHLAAEETLTRALVEHQINAIAYETVQLANGSLPLLTPMSEVAGRMAVQIGAHYLEETRGGRGILLGGVPGVRSGSVVIIGGGTVGINAAQIALGMGARVTVIDINLERLRYLAEVLHGNLTTIASNRRNIATMAPGSVVIDVAVDQGGCIETIHPTSHSAPTYIKHGVIHYAVPNIPGAVPRTSTYALSNATLPYVLKLADLGFTEAVRRDAALRQGVNTCAGQVTYKAVADTFGMEYVPVTELV